MRSKRRDARLLGIILGGVAVVATMNGESPTPIALTQQSAAAAPRQHSSSACTLVKRAVTEQLKAPSTTRFDECWRSGALACLNVDSQNGFGAMVRSRWMVRFDPLTKCTP